MQITNRKVAQWTATIVLVLVGFMFLWLIRNVLFLVFVSILVATGMDPVVNWLRTKGPFSRSTGILFLYVVFIGLLALVLFFTIPPLVQEGRDLVTKFSDPQTVRSAINNLDNDFLRQTATTAYENAGSIIRSITLDPRAISIGLTVFEVIFSTFTVLVIAFYWLTERPSIKRFIFSFVPQQRKTRARALWESVEEKLGAWVRGQLLLMVFIGVLAGIGYTIMGVKFALALAVFAGLTELIPLVGPYLGGAPAVLVALTESVTLALIVIGYIAVLQLLEGNVLVPRIMEKAVGVSALTVIIGILIGATLAGIGGALLAVPIAAAIQVTLNHLISFSAEDAGAHQAAAAAAGTDTSLALKSRSNEQE